MNESPFLPKMWRKIIPKSLKYLIATQKSVSEKQHSRSLQLHNLIRWFEPKQHTYIHSQMEHLCWVLINGRLVRRWCGRTERSQRRSMCFSSRWHAHEIKSEKEQTYSWLSQVTHNMCTSVFLFTVHTYALIRVFLRATKPTVDIPQHSFSFRNLSQRQKTLSWDTSNRLTSTH